MILFTLATSVPFALVALASLWNGAFGWLALGYMTVLVFVLDRLVARQAVNADPEAEFPNAPVLLIGLGVAHLALLGLATWAAGGPSGLTGVQRVVIMLSAGLVFGQISHPVAHELIHQSPRAHRLLGRLIYTSLLFGHHASAHLQVHHRHVGSDSDPNSARLGTGFYRFALRAGPASFVAGMRAENAMSRRAGRPVWRHPYALYLGGALACVGAVLATLGASGLAAFVAICLYAQLQILLSDYVQHYGLRRRVLASGALEPVGPQHSWNAPEWFSSAVTLNAPRHSDHHVTPSRPYPALQLNREDMPCLPRSLPVMAVLALVPPIWRRVMDRRCARWQ